MAYDSWVGEVQRKASALERSELGGTNVVPTDEARGILGLTGTFPQAVQQFHKGALTTMATAISDSGDSPPADAYVQAWKNGTDALTTAMAGAGRDIKDPSLPLLAFRELTMRDARVFWGGLAVIDPAGARGHMIAYRATMQKMMDELDKHFLTLTQSARAVMDAEASLSRQMTGVLADGMGRQSDLVSRIANYVDEKLPSLKDPAKWMRKTSSEILSAVMAQTTWSENKDMWAEFADKISKPGAGFFKTGKEVGIPAGELARAAPFLQRDLGMYVSDTFQDRLKATLPDGTAQVIQAIGTLMDQIEQTATSYRAVRDAFLATLPNHGSVLVLVSDTRRRVDTFIAENGMDKMRDEFQRVKDGLEAWRGLAMADGLKADATEFASVVTSALQARFDAAQASFDTFVTNDGRTFMGTLNGPAEKAVFDPSPVMDERGRLVSLGLDERLAAWRKQLIVIEPMLADYQAGFMDAIGTMPDEIQDDLRRQVTTAFGPLRQGLLASAARAQAAMDRESALAGTVAVNNDLDIGKLRDSLK